MFHQIYELMVLGMHPAILYPRRNQGRPQSVVQQRTFILRDHAHEARLIAGTTHAQRWCASGGRPRNARVARR